MNLASRNFALFCRELKLNRGRLTGLYGWRPPPRRAARTPSVVIVDTIGDLFTLYGAADVAFVGGSLVPHGGQNILEPAAWGRAPIYGPHLGNFLWAQAIIEAASGGILV